VDQKIIDMLLFAKESYGKTDRELNIAMGSVLRIWHNHREEGIDDPFNASLPSMDELVAAAEHMDINDIIIDVEESTVFLKDKDMLLDVGGIAKGYSVERVSQYAMEHGFSNGLISVGGNVRAIGYKGDDQQLWGIGIQNPDSEAENANLFVAHLSNLSVVTSGDYERYFTVDGKQYHHIIDPDTLYPAEYFAAVTIITPDSGMADGLSTAVYNMPFEQGQELIESLPDTEAVWVHHDGKTAFSSGFEKYINQ
jgi:thiamine biosynthesis lipoprotein